MVLDDEVMVRGGQGGQGGGGNRGEGRTALLWGTTVVNRMDNGHGERAGKGSGRMG